MQPSVSQGKPSTKKQNIYPNHQKLQTQSNQKIQTFPHLQNQQHSLNIHSIPFHSNIQPLCFSTQNTQKPDLLNINKTQQFRDKHFLLQNTIESTIQGLLAIYRNKNSLKFLQQQKNMKNQIFDRFALIFSQMNDFKEQIDQTISYLNGDQSPRNLRRQLIPNKRTKYVEGIMGEASQSWNQSQIPQEHQFQVNRQKSYYSPSIYAQHSLQQNYHLKKQIPNMDVQQK